MFPAFVLMSILLQVAEPTWVTALITAVATLLGIPVVQSALSGLLRRITDPLGIEPRHLVWIVGGLFATVALIEAKTALPAFSLDNPPEFIFAWCSLVALWTKTAQGLYDKLLSAWPIFRGPEPVGRKYP
jgi:hypothetical protein